MEVEQLLSSPNQKGLSPMIRLCMYTPAQEAELRNQGRRNLYKLELGKMGAL